MTEGADWVRGRWWRVLDEGGELWMETSSPREVLQEIAAHPTFTIRKLWRREEFEWRPEDMDVLREKVDDETRYYRGGRG